MLLYPVGIPLFYFFRLRYLYMNQKLHDVVVKAQLGFLYAAYFGLSAYTI